MTSITPLPCEAPYIEMVEIRVVSSIWMYGVDKEKHIWNGYILLGDLDVNINWNKK